MYDINKALQNLSSALDDVSIAIGDKDNNFFDLELIKQIDFLTNREIGLRDRIYNEYSKHGPEWASEGYRSAAQALSSITHDTISNTKKSLTRIELLNELSPVQDAFEKGEINTEHVNHLSVLYNDKFYRDDLVLELDLLLENAKVLTAHKFSTALKHWKYMIQDLHEKNDGTLVRYNRRKLSFWQTSVGDWIIEGVLDPQTGELLNRSLEHITSKIYDNSSNEQREDFEIQQANVDALAYLAQGYITNNTCAVEVNLEGSSDIYGTVGTKAYNYAAPLTADITIDIEQLSSSKTTKEFLKETLTGKTPIARAHQKTFIKQILCDTTASFPIIDAERNINLGRKVRLAPLRMKKQLSLLNNQCEVDGCGVPAKWCDAHHVKHWLYGGETKIENLTLLCKRHHTLVHNDKDFEQQLSKRISNKREQPVVFDRLFNTG